VPSFSKKVLEDTARENVFFLAVSSRRLFNAWGESRPLLEVESRCSSAGQIVVLHAGLHLPDLLEAEDEEWKT
jgi:hypothetical protein